MSESDVSVGDYERQVIHDNLKVSSQLLAEAGELGPEIRETMEGWIRELEAHIKQPTSKAELDQLVIISGRFRTLLEEERHDHEGFLSRSREVLEHAAAHAEAEAPVLTQVIHRLLGLLSNLGI